MNNLDKSTGEAMTSRDSNTTGIFNPIETHLKQVSTCRTDSSYTLRAIAAGRPHDRVMIVVIGAPGSGKTTTINKLFKWKNVNQVDTLRTNCVREYEISLKIEEEPADNYLSFVDTPGAFYKSIIGKFRDEHPSLRSITDQNKKVYPNIVVITMQACDSRIEGFNEILRNINSINLIDRHRNNLIILVTFCLNYGTNPETYQSTKHKVRNSIVRRVYDVYDIPDVNVIFIENEPRRFISETDENCNFSNVLPDGELSHKNLSASMVDLLRSNGDVFGSRLTSFFFERDHILGQLKQRTSSEFAESQAPQILFNTVEINLSNEVLELIENIIHIHLFGRGFCHKAGRIVSEKLYDSFNKGEWLILSKMCTLPRSTKIMSDEICEDTVTNKTREEYLTTRMIKYGFDQNMKFSLEPQVSSIGRWNDKESFEGQTVVSFIHEIRLVTLQLPDSLTEDIQKVIQDELNKSKPNNFASFFDTWGSHYITKISIGGSIQFDFLLPDQSKEVEDPKKYIEEVMSKIIDHQKNPSNLNNKRGWEILDHQVKVRTIGGDSRIEIRNVEDFKSEKFASWINSINKNPVELPQSIVLQPFYKFAGTEELRKQMKNATEEYLKKDRLNAVSMNVSSEKRNNKNLLIHASLFLAAAAVVGLGLFVHFKYTHKSKPRAFAEEWTFLSK